MAVRIAIIGLGKIARDQHVPVLRASKQFDLVATADPHGELEDLKQYTGLDELLAAEPGIEAVAICTPPQTHALLARRALIHGCHVLLEKPPAATLAEAEALLSLAREHRLCLFATWHSRYAAGVEPARTWLQSQRIHEIRALWREDVRIWHPGQQWIWEPGGFGVFDSGLNAVSILTRLVSGPFALRDAKLVMPANRTMPIAATLDITTPATDRMVVELDFLHSGIQQWAIHVKSAGGSLELSQGGALLSVNGERHAGGGSMRDEYQALYSRFAALIAARRIDADFAPLQLAIDALTLGRRVQGEPFIE